MSGEMTVNSGEPGEFQGGGQGGGGPASARERRQQLMAKADSFQRRVKSLLVGHGQHKAGGLEEPEAAGGEAALHVELLGGGSASFVDGEGSVHVTAKQAVRDWAVGAGVLEEVAACLVPPAQGGGGGVMAMEMLAGLTEEEIRSAVLRMVDPLCACLSRAVARLRHASAGGHAPQGAGEASGEASGASSEVENPGEGARRAGVNHDVEAWIADNDKFSSETAAYGDTHDFFSGLDGRIGLPSKRPLDGMRDEHCHAADSHDEFVTTNYGGTRTTPAGEWEAVFAPVEGKVYPGKGRTKPRPLQDFVDMPQVCALRLYTGPMYIKYNAILRHGPAALVEACKGNSYVTTLHTIVSGVIKLSRVWSIPPSRRVYRGVAGLRLPKKFWVKDSHGCSGGVELGLMSTTTKREVATHYSMSREGRHATLFEIEVGQIDRGASLMWLSQYPGEEEVLLPPLSNLEVVGRPRVDVSGDGTLVVLPCRINCNLKTLTMDELLGRRKREMMAMQRLLMQETRRTIGGGVWGKGSELAVAVLRDFERLREDTEATEAEGFNDDSFYRDSVNRTLNLKVGTERKWALLHDHAVDVVEGLRARVMASGAERFADDGFIYELRSGTDQVSFSSIISGKAGIVPVPCLDTSQALVVWECVRTHPSCKRVAVLDEGGRLFAGVDTSQMLAGDTAAVSTSRMDPRQIGTLSCGFRLNPNLTTVRLPALFLRDEGAAALAGNLAHCTWLLSLDVGENAIGAEGCRALSDALSSCCTGLTSLRLAWNVIEGAGYEALAPTFAACSSLASLDLFFTRPGPAGLSSFARSLATTSLTNLEIGFSFAGALGTAALGDVLGRNRGIARLDAVDAGSGASGGAAAFLGALRGHTALTSLALFEGVTEGEGCEELLAEVIRGNQGIHSIVFSENRSPAVCRGLEASCGGLLRFVGLGSWPSDPEAVAPLCRVLCRPSLRHLSDSRAGATHPHLREGSEEGDARVGLADVVAEAAREGLSLNPDLVSLSLLETRFDTPDRMRALASFLGRCTSLQTLSIRGCLVTDEGGLHLADAVTANRSSLTILDLGHNRLGDGWARALVPRLAECRALRELVLHHNRMGVEGLTAVVGGVGGLPSLQRLDLSFNGQDFSLGYHCEAPDFLGGLRRLRGTASLQELNLAAGCWPEASNLRTCRCWAQLPPPTADPPNDLVLAHMVDEGRDVKWQNSDMGLTSSRVRGTVER